MCRLLLLNKAAYELIEERLSTFLTFLEKHRGGHGNGVAASFPNQRMKSKKGVFVSAGTSASFIKRCFDEGADWVLFHTRLATSGEKCTKFCQPFSSKKITLAHNGHDQFFHTLGAQLGLSDSAAIHRMLHDHPDVSPSILKELSGVFIGFRKEGPFVIKGESYSDLVLLRHKGAVLFVSVAPVEITYLFNEMYQLAFCEWLGGEMRLLANRKAKTNSLFADDEMSAWYPTNHYTLWQE